MVFNGVKRHCCSQSNIPSKNVVWGQNPYQWPIIYLDELGSTIAIWWDSKKKGQLVVFCFSAGKGCKLIICHTGSTWCCFGRNTGSLTVDSWSSLRNELWSLYREICRCYYDQRRLVSLLCPMWATIWYIRKKFLPGKKKWLASKGLPHNPHHTATDLLKIMRWHRDRYRQYERDSTALEMGYEVLSLLSYHCKYNPVKLTCAQVKER